MHAARTEQALDQAAAQLELRLASVEGAKPSSCFIARCSGILSCQEGPASVPLIMALGLKAPHMVWFWGPNSQMAL